MATTTGEVRRILSLDGGGIKGVMSASFLATVEEFTGKRVVDHFDLIAGTSTGGIIALGLGLGIPAKEILDLYVTKGSVIFGQEPIAVGNFRTRLRRMVSQFSVLFRPKHDPASLRRVLTEILGNRRLGDSHTRLLIPAYHAERRRVYIFKTSHHERFRIDHQCNVVDVAMATAAAPTYFPQHQTEGGELLVDGGVWANNPVGLAVTEAIGVLGWSSDSLRILSLGSVEEVVQNQRGLGWAQALDTIQLLMMGQSSGALGTAKILSRHTEQEPRLFRYVEQVPRGVYALDGIDKIDQLLGLGRARARDALDSVDSQFLAVRRLPFNPYHGQEDDHRIRRSEKLTERIPA